MNASANKWIYQEKKLKEQRWKNSENKNSSWEQIKWGNFDVVEAYARWTTTERRKKSNKRKKKVKFHFYFEKIRTYLCLYNLITEFQKPIQDCLVIKQHETILEICCCFFYNWQKRGNFISKIKIAAHIHIERRLFRILLKKSKHKK